MSSSIKETIYNKIINNLISNSDEIIIESEFNQYSKKEFSNKIAQIFKAIKETNSNNEIIGIALPRSMEQIAAIFAIHLSGFAYTPLDEKLPKQTRDYIISNSGIELIITTADQSHLFSNKQLIIIDNLKNELLPLPTPQIDLQKKAFVIYTSGTTAKPKGVIVSHRALDNFVKAAIQAYSITSKDKYLQFSTINFDSSIEEIFPILVQDGTLVLRNEDFITSYKVFEKYCTQKKITKISLTTVYWNLIVDNLQNKKNIFPPLIDTVVIGGEKAQESFLKKWQSLNLNVRLLNSYGPTETTVVATVADITNDMKDNQNYGEVSIGKAISGYSTFILDQQKKQVAPGEIGELYIGGASVADGYLNMPEKTAQSFVQIEIDGNKFRVYKTGDLVRQRLDGNLEFVGRSDRQVKFNGYRVELNQIENAFIKHPEITDCISYLQQTELTGDQLIAVYTGTSQDLPELKIFLNKILPHYMIPSQIYYCEEFPININGKIDINKIKQLVLENKCADKEPEEILTATQKIIADIWKKYLNRPYIKLDDNFYDIGGHSILIARIMPLINKALKMNVPLATILEHPTLEDFAAQIDQQTFSTTKNIYILKDHKASKNIFFIHGIGGDIVQYQPISEKISEQFNVYGIRATGLDSDTMPPIDLETIAKNYCQQIIDLQSEGPYYLGGHSLGGLFIYKMAEVFETLGKKAIIFLFDSELISNVDDYKKANLPKYARWLGAGLEYQKPYYDQDRILYFQKNSFTQKILKYAIKILRNIFKLLFIPLNQKIPFILRAKDFIFDKDPTDSPFEWERYQRVNKANIYIGATTRISPIQQKVVFFHTQRETSYLYPKLWNYLAPNQHQIIPIPGTHRTIMYTPIVNTTAEIINEIILSESDEK